MKLLPVLAVLVCLEGCVQDRIADYYAPKKPPPCDIPVCDGACTDGRPVLHCISRDEWRDASAGP